MSSSVRSGLRGMASAERQPAAFAVDVRQVPPDAVTVDALARLHVAAKRKGCQISYRGASRELRDLLAFMGLEEVLIVEA
jgi:anti-anti-sigma regulatory factor